MILNKKPDYGNRTQCQESARRLVAIGAEAVSRFTFRPGDSMASTRLSANFTLSEMTQTSSPLANVPSIEAVEALRLLCAQVLQPLRDSVGALHVNSGYRSAAVNAAKGGAATSQHLYGEAADVWADGISAADLARRVVALGLPFDQLIVERPHPAESWLHISYRAGRLRREMLQKTATGYSPWAP